MSDFDAGDGTDGGEREARSVSPAALARRLDRGDPVTILDVRNRTEIERWAIDGERVTRTEIPSVRFQAARVNDGVADLARGIEFASGRGRGKNATERDADGQAEDADGGGNHAGDGRSESENEVDGVSESGSGSDDPVIVVCGRGEASDTVADLLVNAGIGARNLAGGMDAWGELYTATRLEPMYTEATVYQYRRPATGCLSYLVCSGGDAAVIDPLWAFVDRYEDDAATHDASVSRAIDTHVHADHLSGLRELGERGIKVVLPERAAARGVTFDVRTVAAGETVAIGNATLRAVSLPGHTTGMTGFVVGDLLLAGDSVFLEGVARPDLETESGGAANGSDGDGEGDTTAASTAKTADTRELAAELYETLATRLARFDDDTLVAPGHHGVETRPDENGTYTARLGALRERLPGFEAGREAFVERILNDLGAPPANHARIVRANLGVETIAEEEAPTLELGPNNCAAGPSSSR